MPLSTAYERPASWRRPGSGTLRYRQWQDEVVLFNEQSGATHLLSLEALVVLEYLGAGPASNAALGAALSARFEVDEATLLHDVADLLEQLSSLDLIEPDVAAPDLHTPDPTAPCPA